MKVSFIIVMMLLSITSFGQIQFNELIDSLNWEQTEEEFLRGMDGNVRKKAKNKPSKIISDYEIINVFLGKHEGVVSIEVDSTTRELQELSFKVLKNDDEKDHYAFAKVMEKQLFDIFGKPDKVDEDSKYRTFRFISNNTWYLDNCIVSSSYLFGKNNLDSYTVNAKVINDKLSKFRGFSWGARIEDVIKKENKTDTSEEENLYSFLDTVAGMKCSVIYEFNNGELVKGQYFFIYNKHTNKNLYISDYKEIAKLLAFKYGNPFSEDKIWLNDLYRDDPDDYGFAVSLGHLVYVLEWRDDLTSIKCMLFGENYDIILAIDYTSIRHKQEMQKMKLQEKSKDL